MGMLMHVALKLIILFFNFDFMENFLIEFDNVISKLHDDAHIEYISFRAHYSIFKECNIDTQFSFVTFNGIGVTKSNIKTKGKMFKKAKTLYNKIKNCEHITGYKIVVKKSPKCKYKSSTDPNREHLYFNYSVYIYVDGMTPEAKLKDEEFKQYQLKKEKEYKDYCARRDAHIAYYSELNKNEQYQNLGYANGWHETPDIVKCAHEDPDSFEVSCTVGRCLTEYTNHKYKYYYLVDSSD